MVTRYRVIVRFWMARSLSMESSGKICALYTGYGAFSRFRAQTLRNLCSGLLMWEIFGPQSIFWALALCFRQALNIFKNVISIVVAGTSIIISHNHNRLVLFMNPYSRLSRLHPFTFCCLKEAGQRIPTTIILEFDTTVITFAPRPPKPWSVNVPP